MKLKDFYYLINCILVIIMAITIAIYSWNIVGTIIMIITVLLEIIALYKGVNDK